MTTQEYEKFIPSVKGDNNANLQKKIEELKQDFDLGDIFLAAFGLAGEAGEVEDLIKKWIFHDTSMDKDHLKKEMGDVMWYFTLLALSFDFTLDEIMAANAEKLKARFPNGFNFHDANHRKAGDI